MRSWLIVLALALPLLGGVAALSAWVVTVDHHAQRGERLRLALWRLDARAGALLQAEAARPSEHWRSFFPIDRAFGPMLAACPPGLLVASPLLQPPPSPVLLHAEISDGRVTSPQVPEGNFRDLAESGYVTGDEIERMAGRLRSLSPIFGLDNSDTSGALFQAQTTVAADANQKDLRIPLRGPQIDLTQALVGQTLVTAPAEQQRKAAQQLDNDYGNRARNADFNQQYGNANPAYLKSGRIEPSPSIMDTQHTKKQEEHKPRQEIERIGAMSGRWRDGYLLLERTITAADGGSSRLQVVLLDWPAWRQALIAEIGDLLPAAELMHEQPRRKLGPALERLAALPIDLDPGPLALPLSAETWWVLVLAWLGVGLGTTGGLILVVAWRRLAERRAAFVSAVTHELRTPLTALRLHGDLLADERIGGDPVRRSDAIARLRAEAARLGHLVENVLDYARLERRPPRPAVVAVTDVLDATVPRLRERLASVGLSLSVEPPPHGLRCRCDLPAIERILANLADNAAKYAAQDPTRPIDLRVTAQARTVTIQLRDHGPGLDAAAHDRLRRPFERSAEAAAGAAPGIGLGLALCRRLALAQGGRLTFTAPDGGGLEVGLELRRE
ncbi:hypothetical protein LBMAG53_30580 [Planctomycetota bacterium]|nr:hypothetical protein LBMAG53_30580 [Planctomycetota bacterium]